VLIDKNKYNSNKKRERLMDIEFGHSPDADDIFMYYAIRLVG